MFQIISPVLSLTLSFSQSVLPAELRSVIPIGQPFSINFLLVLIQISCSKNLILITGLWADWRHKRAVCYWNKELYNSGWMVYWQPIRSDQLMSSFVHEIINLPSAYTSCFHECPWLSFFREMLNTHPHIGTHLPLWACWETSNKIKEWRTLNLQKNIAFRRIV